MKKPAPEPEIESLEEFRRVLVGRLSDINGNWRICDQRVCRRLRRCAVMNAPCLEKLRASRPRRSPEQEAAAMADLHRRLTTLVRNDEEGVDGRDKPGHDAV